MYKEFRFQQQKFQSPPPPNAWVDGFFSALLLLSISIFIYLKIFYNVGGNIGGPIGAGICSLSLGAIVIGSVWIGGKYFDAMVNDPTQQASYLEYLCSTYKILLFYSKIILILTLVILMSS